MTSHRNLNAYLYASGLILLASLLVVFFWEAGALPTGLAIPLWSTTSEFPDRQIGSVTVVVFSFATGLIVKRYGLGRCWSYLLYGFGGVVIIGVVANLFNIALLTTPLMLSIVLSVVLVQISSLWELDHQLSNALLSSPKGSELVKTGEAYTRLASGLKLLNNVLPISEAVVFQCSTNDDFQTVARLLGGEEQVSSSTRNFVWRDGVKLCDQAVGTKQVVRQDSEKGGSTVAVPLRHQQQTVGVLLLRLSRASCEDDLPLLEAIGAQFARNLARDSFSRNSFGNSMLGYFSTVGAAKKLDAFHVFQASMTEQRGEANALMRIEDGVAVAYLDGTLALVNPALLKFAQVSEYQARNLDVFRLLDHFRTDVFNEPAIAVRRVIQTGLDYENELKFDQRNQILGLRISLLRENENTAAEPVGLAIFVYDLTKIKEYEKLKSDMISLMSHELRTPLTSINGFAELLSADTTLPEQAREFVSIIANESQRMSRMINTFLAVTQLQRKDKQEVLKIPLRLDEVVHETINTLQPLAKKKRIRLVEQPAHRLPPVAADKTLITQVVKNLVDNAIKYSPEKTTVTISTSLEAESVRVSVEDRGFGIPAEFRDRVWEKFYRVVREGQQKDEESTGLGLSFVREVVEQHGGSVALDSEEGRGSKFSFTLPRL